MKICVFNLKNFIELSSQKLSTLLIKFSKPYKTFLNNKNNEFRKLLVIRIALFQHILYKKINFWVLDDKSHLNTTTKKKPITSGLQNIIKYTNCVGRLNDISKTITKIQINLFLRQKSTHKESNLKDYIIDSCLTVESTWITKSFEIIT